MQSRHRIGILMPMSNLRFARDARSWLSGARNVVVCAPAARFDADLLEQFLPPEHVRLFVALAEDTKPGDLGRAASTLTGQKKGPRTLIAGVLPNTVSRYNSPARAESIRRVGRSVAKLPGKTAVALVVDDPAHQLAAVNALAKAMHLYQAKSTAVRTGRGAKDALQVLVIHGDGVAASADKVTRETAEMTREAARLVDMPPSDLHPKAMVQEARALLKNVANVTTREIAGEALLKNNLGGIHAVGRAALVPPRLFIATYSPRKRSKRHIALVGKGISFDTGGLHLKTRVGMVGMKSDMGGAAAVLGAFRALAATGFGHKVSLLLCLAENAIGPASFKPDDILTMHSGKTVEVNNTDAEGRLVLADGVSYAARELGCDTIIDAATLTGAQMISTGYMHGAVVSNDAEIEDTILDVGRDTGDLAHPLPFAPEFYKQEFDSKVADMRNSVRTRANAQSSCAAQFIYWHLDGCDVRWAHLDICGPSMLEERGTGYGVALISETVRRLA